MPVNNEATEAESSSASLVMRDEGNSSSSAPPPKLPPSTTQSEEDARQSVEEDKRHKAQEEAHLQAQQEKARHEAEGNARKQAEELAHLQVQGEEARQAHEREQQQHAEEQARLQAEQETLRLADQEREQTRAEMEAHWKAEHQQDSAESAGRVLEGGVSEKEQQEETEAGSSAGVSDIVSMYIQNASPNPSPVNRQAELESLATVGIIRARFEESSKAANGKNLLFGEAFRQKLRLHQLSDREQKEAAQKYLRGYNDLRGAHGEVDTSNLEKTYSFQNEEEYDIPNDGICKVDYQTQEYQGMVFVVHETRGMLLLNQHSAFLDNNTDSQEPSETINIPGGSVIEKEYLAAAQQSGHSKMQLQLAARQGAARHLFQSTGIDMRSHLQRLTPAIIHSNPPVDENGLKYLKNEHENKLFFFLQVSDADLIPISEPQTDNSNEEADDDQQGKTLVGPAGEMDSPWKLKLCAGVSNFTFVQDPLAAASELGEKGADASVSTALDMLMNLAVGPSNAQGGASTATTYSKGERGHAGSQVLQSKETTQWSGSMTVVETRENKQETSRKESEINSKQKTAQEPNVAQEVACCCGFWLAAQI